MKLPFIVISRERFERLNRANVKFSKLLQAQAWFHALPGFPRFFEYIFSDTNFGGIESARREVAAKLKVTEYGEPLNPQNFRVLDSTDLTITLVRAARRYEEKLVAAGKEDWVIDTFIAGAVTAYDLLKHTCADDAFSELLKAKMGECFQELQKSDAKSE